MKPWIIILIVAAALSLLCYLLYYFGIGFTASSYFSVFRLSRSLPACWEGTFGDTSGYSRRNFVVFKQYSALAVETETTSGTLGVEVKAPDGSILSPASGAYGQNSSALIDVSRFKRCSVTLRMDHFSGKFHIALK